MSTGPFSTHHRLTTAGALPPSQTLIEGLKHAPALGLAADMGCGAGTDTLHLLSLGWKVLAIDNDQAALNRLPFHDRLMLKCQAFESLQLPKVQLINASFALPFCSPGHFDHCWSAIRNALKPGGLFCGHFFGIKDSWYGRDGMSFHTAEDFQQLFKGFQILWQIETEKDGKTLGGASKHWHVFHVVARAPINDININDVLGQ